MYKHMGWSVELALGEKFFSDTPADCYGKIILSE
jgi:hypothetical protein